MSAIRSKLHLLTRLRLHLHQPSFHIATTSHTLSADSVVDKIVPPTLKQDPEGKGFVSDDAEKLITHCCINYTKGGEHVKLKADSEYPEWLWDLRIKPQLSSDHLDPEYDGWLYWMVRNREQTKQDVLDKRVMYRSWFVQHNDRGNTNSKNRLVVNRRRKGNKRLQEPWKG